MKKKKLICSLTEENLAKKRCIGHPKIINHQQGKCVKIPFLGKNENRVPSVFTQYLKIYKSNKAVIFYTNVDKNIPKTGTNVYKTIFWLNSFRVIRN